MVNIYEDNKKLGSIVNRKKALVFLLKYKEGVLSCETKKFSGVRTIAKIKNPVNNEIFVDFEVIQGRGKLILTKNKQVYTLLEGSNKKILLFPEETGVFRLRIAGEGLDSKLSISKKI